MNDIACLATILCDYCKKNPQGQKPFQADWAKNNPGKMEPHLSATAGLLLGNRQQMHEAIQKHLTITLKGTFTALQYIII